MAGKIAHNNLATHSATTITATTEATGFDALNAGNWNLYDFWKGTHASQNILSFDLGSSKAVDYVALFGQDLIDYSGTFKLQWSNDGATGWTDVVGTVTPPDKAAILKTFTQVSKRYWRIVFDATGAAPALAIAAFGEVMTLEKGFRPGFVPWGLKDNASLSQNISEDGIPLGRSKIVKASRYIIPQNNNSAAWIRSTWIPFIEAAQDHPFFMMWDEDNYPLEVVFAWIPLNTATSESITHASSLMATSVNVMGLHSL